MSTEQMKRVAMKPSTGIYYWLPHLRSLALKAWTTEEGGELHLDQWNKYICPMLAEIHGVDATQLHDLYRSIPRGRVDHMGGNRYIVSHGDDMNSADWKNRVKSAFGLLNMEVEFVHESHEETKPDQVAMLKSLGIDWSRYVASTNQG